MSILEDVVRSCLLGTNKFTISDIGGRSAINFPSTLTPSELHGIAVFTSLLADDLDNEGIHVPDDLPTAEDKAETYIPAVLDAEIKVLTAEENHQALQFVISQVSRSGKVVPKLTALSLLPLAAQKKVKQRDAIAAGGKTARWLCKINQEWHAMQYSGDQFDWKKNSTSAKRNHLRNLLQSDEQAARALLPELLATSDADTKAMIFAELLPYRTLNDEPWVETFFKDKSKRVRQEALNLCKHLRGAKVYNTILEYVVSTMVVEKKTSLLILSSRTLRIVPHSTAPDEFLAMGFDVVSPEKGLDDTSFLLIQALEYLDMRDLAQALELSQPELINLLRTQKQYSRMARSLSCSAIAHNNQELALMLLSDLPEPSPTHLRVLSKKQRESYILSLGSEDSNKLIDVLNPYNYDDSWGEYSAPTSDMIVKSLANSIPYTNHYAIGLQLSVQSIEAVKDVIQRLEETYAITAWRKILSALEHKKLCSQLFE